MSESKVLTLFPEASFSVSFYNNYLDYLDLSEVKAAVRFWDWTS